MLKFVSFFVFAAMPTLSFAAPVSPIGLWQTADRGGVVELFDCNHALCGRIKTSEAIESHPDARDVENKDPALRSRLLKGLVILSGFTGGPTKWSGGTLYRPKNGSTYTGTMTLTDANTLVLTGCIFYPLCQSQTWQRLR